MRATELVGKVVLREKPILNDTILKSRTMLSMDDFVHKVPDYAYCTEPVRIVAASDHHVVIDTKVETLCSGERLKRVILDERFCDDNWTDYFDLVGKDAEDPMTIHPPEEKGEKEEEESD